MKQASPPPKAAAVTAMWTAGPLPQDTQRALQRLAAALGVRRIAVMPDVHLSHDVCVGTVTATENHLYPNAVGGDIGCGMATVALNAHADLLNDEQRAGRVLAMLYQPVPGNRHHRVGDLPDFPPPENLSDARLAKKASRDGRVQFATLGRGNHFFEFQSDGENRLWMMVHSGSRVMGQTIREFHLKQAKTDGPSPAYLLADSEAGAAYLQDTAWARTYAAASRRTMLSRVAERLAEMFAVTHESETYVDCCHNHVRHENHGEALWVHRKGALSAKAGEAGLIPGSMGSSGFHVLGRGETQALCSSSHGAGRCKSRTEARKSISVKQLTRELRGVWYDRRLETRLCDEAPSAYKDIRAVMRAQTQLTKIVRELQPILVYKST